MKGINFTDVVEYLGTVAFAISGIRMASRKHFDYFGAFVIGFITAIGGGTVRDLLIQKEVFWLTSPSYFLCTLIGMFMVIVFKRIVIKLDYTFFIFDAAGLGLFTLTGIVVTLDAGYSMFMAIIMGTITGSVGGIIRDVLINELPLVFREDIYATASIAGGLIFACMHFFNAPYILTQIVTIISIILIRVLVVRYSWHFPSFKDNNSKF
ncbi:MAG: trimeric intracellular cation channel family protein [Bacteroidetes bacterium]|nr:trimeric intracellular cation channel family protein [Bacteroidota bacterium]